MSDLFGWFQEYYAKEQLIREQIKGVTNELAQTCRTIDATLQQCHNATQESAATAVATAKEQFAAVRESYEKLKTIVPADLFYRYHNSWRQNTQTAVYLAALTTFLDNGTLISKEQIQSMLGVSTENEGFHLDLEDYLMGVCLLPQELVRLATNSVTMGDFQRPLAISTFVAELYAGFRLLNLKNDGLRKRFDSIKYDVKRIEGIVYDLSIRGLTPQAQPQSSA